VVLTAAGEALVGPARQALRDVESATAAVAAVVGLESGRLDLCALPTLAVDPVAPLVGTFRTRHPGVAVRLVDSEGPAELASRVTSGDAEVGITVEHTANAALDGVKLGTQEMLGVLPPGTSPVGRALAARDLGRHPIVTTPSGTSTRELLDDAFAAANVTPHVAVVTAQREAVLPLVLAGAGATLLPEPTALNARRLGAVVVPLRPRVTRHVVAVYRDGTRSPAAAAFLGLATSQRAPRTGKPASRHA
jgi:DNA-binding transcriptional LysR family regulator